VGREEVVAHLVITLALVAVLRACAGRTKTVERTVTVTRTVSPTLPPPTSVRLVVSSGFADTTVFWTSTTAGSNSVPLDGQQKWQLDVAVTPTSDVGVTVEATPTGKETSESLWCSIYVGDTLLFRDVDNSPVLNHPGRDPFVRCTVLGDAIQARKN
jgi:hypothetical protein